MDTVCREGAFSPLEVEELLLGELGRTVRAAVLSVARIAGCDPDPLLDEVRSDLALKMLSGRFAGHDPLRASFRTYLAAAARNSARDILRARRRAAVLGPVDLEAIAGPGEDGPPSEVLREEIRGILAEALAALEAEDRRGARILEARYLDGLPYPEIARREGGSAGAVHLWAHRARRSLLRKLRRRGIGE